MFLSKVFNWKERGYTLLFKGVGICVKKEVEKEVGEQGRICYNRC
ncbi:hypothetical protein FH5_04507 [Priestia endophytica]|nr:hypothetical protein FH5_04507 [Priestia endophytica]